MSGVIPGDTAGEWAGRQGGEVGSNRFLIQQVVTMAARPHPVQNSPQSHPHQGARKPGVHPLTSLCHWLRATFEALTTQGFCHVLLGKKKKKALRQRVTHVHHKQLFVYRCNGLNVSVPSKFVC